MRPVISILFILFNLCAGGLFAQWNVSYNALSSSEFVTDMSYHADHSVHISRNHSILYSQDNGGTWSTVSTFTGLCPFSGSLVINAVDGFNKDTVFFGGSIGSSASGDFFLRCYNNLSSKLCQELSGESFSACNDMCFADHHTGYVLNYSKDMYKTVNGGVSWTLQYDLGVGSSNFELLDFPSKDTGYVFIDGSKYKTYDGGMNYSPINLAGGNYVTASHFINTQTGYVIVLNLVSGDQFVVKTNNGGNTWTTILPSGNGLQMEDIHFTGTDTGYVCGKKFILKTVDGGTSWHIQRFNNYHFQKIDFINNNEGMVAGDQISGGKNIVMKTSNGGGTYKPFAFFTPTLGYCCEFLPCNIHLEGPVYYTYDWYVDGAYAGTGSPPAISVSSAYHLVELHTNYAGLTDTFSLSVYSAGPLPGYYTLSGSVVDSTICSGSTVSVSGINTYSDLHYALFNGGSILSTLTAGTGSNIDITSFPYTGSDFTLSVRGNSDYSYCPGNTLDKDFNITVYQPPPASSIFADKDSVCKNDTVIVSVQSNTGETYTLHQLAYTGTELSSTSFTGTGLLVNNAFIFDPPLHLVSCDFKYTVNDINGCTFTTPSIRVKYDSIVSRIYTPEFTYAVGDSVNIRNYSTGIYHHWHYPSNTIYYDTLNPWLQKVGFSTADNNYIDLIETNKTGCADTSGIYVTSAFLPDTSLLASNCQVISSSFDMAIHPYYNCFYDPQVKMHIDHEGNMYVATWDLYPTVPFGVGDGTVFRLSKYNPSGILMWNKKAEYDTTIGMGYTYLFSTCDDIATDTLGNVYIIGQFTAAEMWFGSFAYTQPFLKRNSYIAKLDSTGTYKWVLFTDNGSEYNHEVINAIEYLDDRHIYIHTGTSHINCNFTNGPEALYGIVQIDSAGNFIRRTDLGFSTIYYNSCYYIDQCSGFDNAMIPEGLSFTAMGNRLIAYQVVDDGAIGTYRPPTSDFYPVDPYALYNKAGVVTIFDTSGNFIRSFLAFQYFQEPYNDDDLPTPFEDPRPGFSSMTVDKNFNIHTAFYPYARMSYYADSLPLFSNYRIYIPGEGLFVDQGGRGLIQKYDTSGNSVYANFTSARVQSLTTNNDGNLYGNAHYGFAASFTSRDSNTVAMIDHKPAQNSVLFCYSPEGNINWVEPILADSISMMSDLSARDSCNPDLYFMAIGHNDSISFNNTKAFDGNNGIIFHFSPTGACSNIHCAPGSGIPTAAVTPPMILSDIRVYPNPFSGQVNIVSKAFTTTAPGITVSTITGQVLYSRKYSDASVERITIDLSSLASGQYIIRVVAGENLYHTRIVKL